MYVILQPHSNTNHSDKYRVVDNEDWTRYINGAIKSVAIAGEFDNLTSAIELRDRLNNG